MHASARSLGVLLHDGWHDFTHLDGRVWRTMRLLFTKPGELSRLYFANRRASFLPPVRLYLIASICYFAALGLISTGEHKTPRANTQTSSAQTNRQQIGVPRNCDSIRIENSRWLEQRYRNSCLKINADGGASLWKTFGATIPRALFLFLPLMAALLLLFYWKPRRLYVEHLVFLLHTHAVLFLGLLLLRLFHALSHRVEFVGSVSSYVDILFVLWLGAYCVLAMRRFYAQGWVRTLLKGMALAVSYLLAFFFLMAVTFSYAALVL